MGRAFPHLWKPVCEIKFAFPTFAWKIFCNVKDILLLIIHMECERIVDIKHAIFHQLELSVTMTLLVSSCQRQGIIVIQLMKGYFLQAIHILRVLSCLSIASAKERQ